MLRLQDAATLVVVTPEYGGAILGWTDGPAPVLRRPEPDAMMRGDVRGFGCFPLVPYCNRIVLGRFAWQGRTYQLDRNFGGQPHTIHGIGWQRPWSVQSVSRVSATLTLRHDAAGDRAGAWPFAFDATLSYALSDRALHIGLAVINRHAGLAPAGIGLHPYFVCHDGVTLQFKADGVWINDTDTLPARHTAVPREWDHADGLPVGAIRLDNCFTAWDRRAHIGGIGGGVTVTADAAFHHLQIYTPHQQNFFCAEPVSHVPDAINRDDLPPGQGMRVLQPGEMLSGSITIALTSG